MEQLVAQFSSDSVSVLSKNLNWVRFLKTSLILALLWFPSLLAVIYFLMSWRVPWLLHKHLFYLSGSTPLQDVIQVNTYPVHRKKNMNSCFLSPHTSPTSLSRTSLLLPFWMRHYICDFETFRWSFLLYHPRSALTVPLWRKGNYCTQTQLWNPADGRIPKWPSPFVSDVFEWSHEISQHPFTPSQSKRSHFFLELKCSPCINVFSADASSLMEPPLLYLVSPWRQTLNH